MINHLLAAVCALTLVCWPLEALIVAVPVIMGFITAEETHTTFFGE